MACVWMLTLLSWSFAADGALAEFVRPLEDYERQHWAFQPIVDPELPEVMNSAWVTNPVDAFILARLEDEGMTPARPADRRTWLRRVWFDLVGLPPPPETVEKFLADDRPDAEARMVDTLLASPHYGERWGRHWLDVVRYAESNGYERDGAKPHAWRYRDYVIASFNADKPIDQFLVEQLAGDELDDTDADKQIATTFLRLGTWDDEPADPLADRYDQLDDVVGVTASAFLGLTMQCARCHAHKYEPLSQVDYSRMLAVFSPLRRPQDGRTELDRFVGTPRELEDYRVATEGADKRIAALREQLAGERAQVIDRGLANPEASIEETVRAALATPAEQRTEEQKKLLEAKKGEIDQFVAAQANSEEAVRWRQWEAQIAAIDAARPPAPPRAYIWYEESPTADPTPVFHRGDPRMQAGTVEPGLPEILAHTASGLPSPREKSTGRRLWLARWLVSPENPLTARVFANRVWQFHFGTGLVATPNDFGLMADAPSHPELLDWLAAQLRQNGWRLKPLHRMIVLSNTYRQSAAWNEAAAEIDPENRLWWRWTPQRLQAEPLRDAALAVSGKLDPQVGGPSIFPPLPQAVLDGQSVPGQGWTTSPPEQVNRRSVYVFVKRSLLVPELELMDFPGGTSSCPQRPVSTIAPQALTMLNGAFMQEQAAALADRLRREAGDDFERQLDRGFLLTLARPPTPAERTRFQEFVARYRRESAETAAETKQETEKRTLHACCVVLLNCNEFVYLD